LYFLYKNQNKDTIFLLKNEIFSHFYTLFVLVLVGIKVVDVAVLQVINSDRISNPSELLTNHGVIEILTPLSI